ncbi:FAD-binding protein [Spirosoma montaniterrae]|uniref:FAD-linked oxidase n=1 Tax=Spirosoma montaniterrae TaxID=1178516 RepID=A0A1P9WV93_9BACT|nr:FAD-binding protein [Spirosoma montaniterrae]AQG79294.1 FAD-linked oxidase [Spirosoma montaniterrae]
MSLPNGLEQVSVHSLTNRHQNFTQPLTPGASFKLRIPNGLSSRAAYQQTTANFQWLIQYALDRNLRLRAIGKNWSFTKVGVTNGGMVDTNALMQTFTLTAASVAPAYTNAGKSASNLFFTECGTTVHILEQKLEAIGKSIRASGASNGQTIAGAISTGTHGAAFGFGATQDMVVGIHLVCGPDRHVWLERATYPVVSQSFTDGLGISEVLRDDDLFNAALVSFGSFSFIHGVLLDVEDLFWLKSYSKTSVPYNTLEKAMSECDFSALKAEMNLPDDTDPTAGEAYHFQTIVNPHQIDLTGQNNDRGPFVRVLYKHKAKPDGESVADVRKADFTYGDDTLGLIQTLLDRLRPRMLVPTLVNKLYPMALEHTDGLVGTMREFFAPTNIRGKACSSAIGIDAKDSLRVLAEICALNRESAFPGVMGLRWVKGTQATLGFTKFPITCVLELDGIESNLTNAFLHRVWNRLDALHIPFTMHWGKVNFGLDAARIRRMYGSRVDAWLMARERLLDAPTRAVFTNEFMEQCGLAIVPVPVADPVA